MSKELIGFELESQDVEVQAFLLAMYLKYGYDFREYSFVHIKRRILFILSITNIESISMLLNKMLYDKEFFESRVLPAFSVNVTEMFRDESFFKALREEVIPVLKEREFLKVWHAGCSTGEEVYSMAIILMEEGLYDQTQIYATDFNETVLNKARDGCMSIDEIKISTKNYHQSGGQRSFSDYYSINGEVACINREILNNIVFANHNLVTDGVFGEMNLIVCRNVLIYFTNSLQKRVIKLFSDSLEPNGFLCLGSKESLREVGDSEFDTLLEREKIYVKN